MQKPRQLSDTSFIGRHAFDVYVVKAAHTNPKENSHAIHGLYDPRRLPTQERQKLDPHHTPDVAMMEKMMKFNKELEAAGAILAVDGLQPLPNGARLAFSGGKAKVTDGPFVEAKEVVGGYWLLQAQSKEQVVEWMKRCPAQDGDTLEIRQIFEVADFT